MTADQAAINNAISAASDAGGGIVFIPIGTYATTGAILMKSYVTLQGAGKYASMIKKLSGNGNMIELYNARQEQIQVRDLCLNGNFAGSTGDGIYILNDSVTNGTFASGLKNARHRFSNLLIRSVVGNGINFAGDAFCGGNETTGVQVYFCGLTGILTATPDSVFANCDVGQAGAYGYRDTSGYNRFVGCKAWLSGRLDSSNGDGFRITSHSQLADCSAEDSARNGFNFFSAINVVAVGLAANTNGKTTTGNGVSMQSAQGCYVQVTAWDRGGDSGTDPAVQQFAVNASSATKNIIDITAGLNASGAFPSSQINTDNTVRTVTLGAVGRLQVGASLGLVGTGYIEAAEISDPSAPAANTALVYVRDNGGGKSQFVVRFPTGAIQVVATEP